MKLAGKVDLSGYQNGLYHGYIRFFELSRNVSSSMCTPAKKET